MKFLKRTCLLATAGILALLLDVAAAQAQVSNVANQPLKTPAAERLRVAVERNTKGKVVIEAVYASPVPGIFEAVAGDDVFYLDATGRYGFVDGRLIDLETQVDLTAIRIDRVTRIDFARLPLDLAIKEVHGNGRRKLAVFEDPLCPICKMQTKFIAQLPDTTVYRFMYPVIDPKSSVELARNAWCAPDRKAAWNAAMRGEQLAGTAQCDVSGLARILELGDALRVQETPTVFLGNGRRLKGAVPPEEFIKALDASLR